ncbi:MAG: hypothetical protein M0Z42_18905 [Actinomycetota bacterium]|nr:hypothetical protein [Actinomycetota bacterium]
MPTDEVAERRLIADSITLGLVATKPTGPGWDQIEQDVKVAGAAACLSVVRLVLAMHDGVANRLEGSSLERSEQSHPGRRLSVRVAENQMAARAQRPVYFAEDRRQQVAVRVGARPVVAASHDGVPLKDSGRLARPGAKQVGELPVLHVVVVSGVGHDSVELV